MIIRTATDMYNATLEFLNKEATASLSPEEFEIMVNAAQLEYVKNRYDEAEKTQKRIDDLRSIMVINESILNSGANVAASEVFELPYDDAGFVTTAKNPTGTNHGYLFMLNCALKLSYVNNKCGFTGISEFLKAKPMKADKRNEIERDPFNRPTDERLYYQETGDQVIVFTGTQSFATEARIDYLRYPVDIQIVTSVVDSELPIHARTEIVDIVVRKVLENIESQRYSTNLNENNKIIV